MVRVHKKKLGGRTYRDYPDGKLEECLEAIKSKRMTQRQAAEFYKIPRSTLKYKLSGAHSKNCGRSPVLSEEEEKAFEEHIVKLGEFGFPVVEMDVRMAVKYYLDKKGAIVKIFKSNLPGYEWMKSFLKRHPSLTCRFSTNIKKNRAAVSEDTICEYMDNLKVSIDGIPPERVYNYDETCLSDDPGKKKVVCKRGSKYIESIANYSKSSTSVMFCGSAAGELLPPYTVYKAEHMWSTWVENGPEGARYNRSKSGWFDSICFEDWFASLFLPCIRRFNREPVLLLGDNLSSHINLKVLEACEENNVRFVCLPPNTTHIAQPLDVAYFGPMKRSWRKIMADWKNSKSGSKYSTIPKDLFPSLLNKLLDSLEEKGKNLISGFEKCGISPLNREKLLSRLPSNNLTADITLIGESFLENLEQKREEFLGKQSGARRKKVAGVPGKSISASDLAASLEEGSGIKKKKGKSDVSSSSDESAADKPSPPKCRKTVKKKKKGNVVSSGSSDESEMSVHSEFECESSLEGSLDEPVRSSTPCKISEEDCKVDDYVVVNYNGSKFPGKICRFLGHEVEVSCLEKALKCWRWPQKPDKSIYAWENVLFNIKPPIEISKRNQYRVPELEDQLY